MNNQISLDSTTIRNQAAHIRQLNISLNEQLIAIKKTIEQIKAEWDSPAGNDFAGSFAKILPDFENSTKFISRYANFLDVSIEAYEETERRINQGASSFGN